MGYYLATVKNEIMPFAATRMELEMIILSEVRQRQILQIPYGITYIWINNMMEINFNKDIFPSDKLLESVEYRKFLQSSSKFLAIKFIYLTLLKSITY